MAHRIEERDKLVGTFKFWHGLNDVVEKITPENNPLVLWDAEPTKLLLLDEAGNPIDSGFSILRGTDDKLPIGAPFNPETYVPVYNSEFVEMVENALAGTKHKLVSAGSVRNRGRVFISVELADVKSFKSAGREFKSYLNFLGSFDKSAPLTIVDTEQCTQCDNLFQLNLGSKGGELNIRLTHKKGIKAEIAEMPKIIDSLLGVRAEFKAALDGLAEIKMTEPRAEKLFAGFLGTDGENFKDLNPLSTRSKNQVDELTRLFKTGRGNTGENLMDVFQAGTEFYTHFSSGGEDRQKQFVSSEFGAALKAKKDLFSLVTNSARVKETEKAGAEILKLTEKAGVAKEEFRSAFKEAMAAIKAGKKVVIAD